MGGRRALPAHPEQDSPKIGLVDSSKIIANYFQDSKAMRDLMELKDTDVLNVKLKE